MQLDVYRIEIRAIDIYGTSRAYVVITELPPLPDLSRAAVNTSLRAEAGLVGVTFTWFVSISTLP